MSFREKSAWITLVTVVVCFGIYFGSLVTGLVKRGPGALHLLLLCVLALALLQLGLGFIAARTTPKDGRAPRDEREVLIQARSHSLGYYLLIGLVLAVAASGHLGHDVVDLMNFALLAVVLAVTAVAVAQIAMFRRGW
jgi:hypothetical protein